MEQEELLKTLTAVADKMGLQVTPRGGGGWGAPAPAQGMPKPAAVEIPIKLQTPRGSIRMYLMFDGVDSLEAILGLLERLDAMGVPLDIYENRDRGWGGGGWQQRGGYGNGNGGGYRRWGR